MRIRLNLLGSPLPGVILLPNWRVEIERRGSAEVLTWRVADSPGRPADIDGEITLVSVPRAVPAATLKRGTDRLVQRLRGNGSGQPPSLEEFMAAFSAAGGQVQSLRQMPPGAPPFFGGAGALDDFITLADQPNQVVLAFAGHWGPLGICRHGLPWTHSLARCSPVSVDPICRPRGVATSRGRKGWEPLQRWRDYSRQAKAITLDAIALKNRRVRLPDQFEPLFNRVAAWLELAAVPLATYAELDADQSWPCGFQATFAIGGVFQILALQLLGVVAGGRELKQCTHCGLPFVLTGHREGKRRFCPSCVDHKIPMRYAARDYRARGSGRRPG
jgi:hypothetical protein